MALLPDTKPGKIAFVNARITAWTDNAVAIGTTSGAMTDLAAKLATATEKLDGQVAAQAVAKTATAAADEAVAALAFATMDVVRQVRVKANTAGPGVYELAQIPAPATPAPLGMPGTPTDFSVTLNPDGSLKSKWRCQNPSGATGTIYQLWRKLPGATTFSYIGGTGAKEYTDATVPAGTAQIIYKIQAVRSTAGGVFAVFNVFFGTAGDGAMTASVQPVMKAA